MPSRRNCSVFACTNTYENTFKKVKFYSFPSTSKPWLSERRKAWIRFVKRKTTSGEDWQPTKNSRICSVHFVDGVKSEDPRSPSYNPTIRDVNHAKSSISSERYNRIRQRETTRNCSSNCKITVRNGGLPKEVPHNAAITGVIPSDQTGVCLPGSPQDQVVEKVNNRADQDPGSIADDAGYNLYASLEQNNANERDNDIGDNSQNSTRKRFCDAISGPDSREVHFSGYSSVINSGTMNEVAGISPIVFSILMSLFPNHTSRIHELSLENKLLLTLMKLKTGLPFTTIGLLFGLHRTTVANIFNTIMRQIYHATRNWIVFPSKFAIQQTMPKPFKTNYPTCRIIIDCTEIKTEMPPTIEQRVQMYSVYKSGFTAKYLIGITPAGLISYISKGYGGRATDSFITNDCGLLDLLENGDTVLADKGFPHIRVRDGITLVMPPFASRHDKQFSSYQMQETYKVASVRIHVERAIQRLKLFNILNTRVPVELLGKLDVIMHVLALLVNLGPPLINEM